MSVKNCLGHLDGLSGDIKLDVAKNGESAVVAQLEKTQAELGALILDINPVFDTAPMQDLITLNAQTMNGYSQSFDLLSNNQGTLAKFYRAINKASDNKLETVSNFFAKVKANPAIFGIKGKDEQKLMTNLVNFNESFSKAITDNFLVKDPKFSAVDRTQLLLGAFSEQVQREIEKNNKLPTKEANAANKALLGNLSAAELFDPNVLSAMSMTTFNWLSTRANETKYNDNEDINRMNGFDSKALISPARRKAFGKIGSYRKNIIKDLGKPALSALNIKSKKNVSSQEQGNLEAALGTLLLGVMIEQGYVTQEIVLHGSIKEHYADDRGVNDNTEHSFIRVATVVDEETGYDVVTPQINEMIENVKTGGDVLGNLFGIESHIKKPSLVKPTKVSEGVLKTLFRKATKKSIEGREKHQQHSYKMLPTATKIMDALGVQKLANSIGFVENVDSEHVTQRESVLAQNEGIMRSLTNAFEWKKEAGDKPFWFSHDVWKNNRWGMVGNLFNLQADPNHRFLAGMESHTSTLDKNNADHMLQFELAVAEAFGIKVEREFPEVSIEKLREKLDTLHPDQDVAKNAAIIRSGLLVINKLRNGETINTAEQDRVAASISAAGGSTHAMLGLIGLSERDTSTENTFNTDLTRETDGITNGIIIAMTQFSATKDRTEAGIQAFLAKLARGGLFSDGTASFPEYMAKIGSLDTYQSMIPILEEILGSLRLGPIHAAIDDIVGSLRNDDGSISSAARDLLKDPTLIVSYGGGMSKIRAQFAQIALQGFYKAIAKANNEGNQEKLDSLSASINTVLGLKEGSQFILTVGSANESVLSKKDEAYFVDAFDAYYGEALKEGLNEVFKPLMDKRQEANNAIKVIYEGFKIQFDKELAKTKAARAKDTDSQRVKDRAATDDLSQDEWLALNQRMVSIMPIYDSFFSRSKEEGILVMKETNEPAIDQGHKVEISFKNEVHSKQVIDGKEKVISSKSMTTHSTSPTWEDGGVSGGILGIHSLDSAMVQMLMERFAGTNVFDAYIFKLTEVDEGSRAFNESFEQITREYSLGREISKSLTATMALLKKNDIHGYNDLGRRLGLEYDRENNVKNGYLGFTTTVSLDTYVKNFHNITVADEKFKQEILKRLTGIGQYNNGSPNGTLIMNPGVNKPLGTVVVESIEEVMVPFVPVVLPPDQTPTQNMRDALIRADGLGSILAAIRGDASTRDITKTLVDRLEKILPKELPVVFIQKKDEGLNQQFLKHGALGLHYPEWNGVKGNSGVVIMEGGDNVATVVHELIHAATYHMLHTDTGNKELRDQLGKLRVEILDTVKNDTSGNLEGMHIALSNIDEMVTYGFTDSIFQEKLNQIKVGKVSALTKFFDIIRNMLGLPVNSGSALEELLKLGETLFEVTPEQIDNIHENIAEDTDAHLPTPSEKAYAIYKAALRITQEDTPETEALYKKYKALQKKEKIKEWKGKTSPSNISVAAVQTMLDQIDFSGPALTKSGMACYQCASSISKALEEIGIVHYEFSTAVLQESHKGTKFEGDHQIVIAEIQGSIYTLDIPQDYMVYNTEHGFITIKEGTVGSDLTAHIKPFENIAETYELIPWHFNAIPTKAVTSAEEYIDKALANIKYYNQFKQPALDAIAKLKEGKIHGLKVKKLAMLEVMIETIAKLERKAKRTGNKNPQKAINLNNTSGFVAKEITRGNVTQTFTDLTKLDHLNGTSDSDAHTVHLAKVVNQLGPMMDSVALYTRTHGSVTESTTDDNGIYLNTASIIPASLTTQQSNTEAFAHGMVFTVLGHALDHSTWATKEVKALFEMAQSNPDIKPEIFLPEGLLPTDTNYAAELELATERYDIIFSGKLTDVDYQTVSGTTNTHSTHRGYQEFAAYGATNAAFRNALSKISGKTKEKLGKDATFNDKLSAFFGRVYQWIREAFSGTLNTSVDSKLNILLSQLIVADKNGQRKLAGQMSYDPSIFEQVTNKVARAAVAPIYAIAGSSIAQNTRIKTISGLAKVITKSRETDGAKFIEALVQVRKNMTTVDESLTVATIQELKGITKSDRNFGKLKRWSNHMIDQMRRLVSDEISREVMDNFAKGYLTKPLREAVTRGLLKTNATVLFQPPAGETEGKFSITQLNSFYDGDNKAVDAAIKDVLLNDFQQYKSKDARKNYYDWYTLSAQNLGHHMAKGYSTLRFTLLNSKAIAQANSPTVLDTVTNYSEAGRNIEVLAALYAIKNTNSKVKRDVQTVMKREMSEGTANGITFTMQMHEHLKQDALATAFDGQELLMQDGYIKEIFNPNIRYQLAPLSSKKDLAKDGFVLVSNNALQKDFHDPSKQKKGEELYYYINRNGSAGTWMAGIFSLTSGVAAGTNLTHAHTQQGGDNPALAGYLDFVTVNRRKIKEADDIAQGKPVFLSVGETSLIPVINANGGIADYRYMMSENSKIKYLEKNDNVQTVLGGMAANTKDKVNTKFINNKTIDEIHAHFRKNYKGKSSGYSVISATSANARHRELWFMLPDEARAHAKKVTGRDALTVPTELIPLIFGQRKRSVANFKLSERSPDDNEWQKLKNMINDVVGVRLNRPSIVFAESVWQETVKAAKDAIVVKTGGVLAGNIGSNTIILKTMGVSIKYIVKYHHEALVGARAYIRDSRQLHELERQILLIPSKKNDQNLKNQIANLKHNLANNPVRELIEEGIHQSIIEDLTHEDEYYTHKNAVARKIEETKILGSIVKHTPAPVKFVGKQLLMTHDTAAYKFMLETTQLSDFAARYVLFKHNSQKLKMDYNDNIDLIQDIFVNYDLPTSPGLQYANDMGLVMFSKFFLRIQKVILYLAKNHPGGLLATVLTQELLDYNASDVFDANMFDVGNISNKLHLNPIETALEILTAPMAAGVLAG